MRKERPLNKEDRKFLPASGIRAGLISSIAYYGGFLFLLPMTLGGALGNFFNWAFGTSKDISYLAGFLIVFIAGLAFLLRNWRKESRTEESYKHKRTAAIDGGIVHIYDLRIIEAWDFDYTEDVPVYVFKLDSGEFAIVSSQAIWDFPEGSFPQEFMQIEVIPYVGYIVSMNMHGRHVNPVEVEDEEIEKMSGCPLFDFLIEGKEFGISDSNPFFFRKAIE